MMQESKSMIAKCEACDMPICEGDEHHMSVDIVYLCRQCSPHLSDAIRQHEEILYDNDIWAMQELGYAGRTELEAELTDMKTRLAVEGDASLAVPA